MFRTPSPARKKGEKGIKKVAYLANKPLKMTVLANIFQINKQAPEQRYE
jgi:hypothetical protein